MLAGSPACSAVMYFAPIPVNALMMEGWVAPIRYRSSSGWPVTKDFDLTSKPENILLRSQVGG